MHVAQRREWLLTNGLGGYASGTVAGLLTRRYHGLLIAATAPPVGRTLLVPKIEETISYAGRSYELSANRWADGTVAPSGFIFIESFALHGTAPVWRYACGDAVVEKRIWMAHGANVTCVGYLVERAQSSVAVSLKLFADARDHHGTTRAAGNALNASATERGVEIRDGATLTSLVRCTGCTWTADNTWYYGFDLLRERERGLEPLDDHLCAAHGRLVLEPGASAIVELRAADAGDDPAPSWEAFAEREVQVVRRFTAGRVQAAPQWIERLALAADQFVVRRAQGASVIAGYPWFTDWGRDTMISLPGLTLVAGKPDVARSILLSFASFVKDGLLPNRFPDAGTEAEYNTADATLWYFVALRAYVAATGDDALPAQLFPVLKDIIERHVHGTSFGIKQDPADGLLLAGEPGVQLTWMDAKVGDWVVTPRIGKPVEINALWYHALRAMSEFARKAGRPDGYDEIARKVREGFERFWNEGTGYCFDVLDGSNGNDDTLRPNQVFALSLSTDLLSADRRKSIAQACERELLTPRGLRTLPPNAPGYRGRYDGDPAQRDGAYHQGTAWGFLLGPFALAHKSVFGDADTARKLLAPMEDALLEYGAGTLAEICDGDAPHAPNGCIAQAWTVAETLRAWHELQ